MNGDTNLAGAVTVKQKQCSKCRLVKDADHFPRQRSRRDGLHIFCRVCNREKCREYRSRPEVKERQRKQRSTPEAREKRLEVNRRHYAKHREDKARQRKTPLGRAKGNLHKWRSHSRKEQTPERMAVIRETIAFYEAEVARLEAAK